MILEYRRRYCFGVQRSKVKVTGSITLSHNNTLFRTTIAFDSHSLGGDTSTIILQPRFIVILARWRGFVLYEYILIFTARRSASAMLRQFNLSFSLVSCFKQLNNIGLGLVNILYAWYSSIVCGAKNKWSIRIRDFRRDFRLRFSLLANIVRLINLHIIINNWYLGNDTNTRYTRRPSHSHCGAL